MKFGRNLTRNQVPEWSDSYINYKGLKKFIKAAAESVKAGRDADLTALFYTLDRNVEDVSVFFDRKMGGASRRLELLQDRYGRNVHIPEGVHPHEIEDLMGALLELRGQLRKLQWYAEVNRRGFIKITKKLDKKVPRICAQRRYIESRVDPRPFATNAGVPERMKVINDWLSTLGDVKTGDDSNSVHSTHSMGTVSSMTTLDLSTDFLNKVDESVRKDDSASLSALFSEIDTEPGREADHGFQKLLLKFLQRSISSKAKSCIDQILSKVATLDEEDDINGRNCIHRFIIGCGRLGPSDDAELAADLVYEPNINRENFITPAAAPILAPPLGFSKDHRRTHVGREDSTVSLLEFLLGSLRPHQRSSLLSSDIYGRKPLHYAAHIGFVVICQILVERMQQWDQFDVSEGIDSSSWQDHEGWAPLHLSVVGGHPSTTKYLLEAENWRGESNRNATVRRTNPKSGAVLALAARANFITIVKLLVEAGVDINYQDEQGETALHVAARYGHEECALALLEGTSDQQANAELAEKTFAWTPIFVAAVENHLEIVELLLEAGVELEKPDLSGWTVKEHASLRGHLAVARRLAAETAPNVLDREGSTFTSAPPSTSSTLEDRTFHALGVGNGVLRTSEPVKTFGHRYLTNESMVLVSLGTMDPRKSIDAVKLDRIPLSDAHSTKLDTALSVVVSATSANGEPTTIDLPVQENISTEPIVFMSQDPGKVKLLFDIVPTYAGSKDHIVGRGVALLSSVKPSIGSQRITLQGDVSVPIVAADTLDFIGTVNFNFLIIAPFSHPSMSLTQNQTYWKSLTSTMLIGHRGKNALARKSLQLGENTIQSFIAAANLGASYVEFGKADVQLTKDHVPVIYHDFLVSETGIDAPVHTLTLEQFLHVNDGHHTRESRPSSPSQPAHDPHDNGNGGISRRTRSLSLGCPRKGPAVDMSERMKHTRDFKMKGYKGNSRGNFIQAPFTTLEEMFKKLPESIGFNIEIKYPMLHESEEQEMDTYAVELNSFVDTVLTKVYDLSKKRNVIFSSFNPDICLLLSFKQPSIPILFLTDAGTCPVGDIRASSLQEAIRFASRWNLLGVVTAAEPLVISPRLVKVVKESGLVCVSYGVINNDPEKVQLQVREGIDAVIVDSVLAIRQGLTGGGVSSSGDDKASDAKSDPATATTKRTKGDSDFPLANGTCTTPAADPATSEKESRPD
ncbi:MAG: Glycerophosphocholine phosphodiesterase [Sclerophora amabilis]|nr:MAG: Glycerophosphocholine phosphodiesterase [Sclerophora amabilis]